MSDFLFDGAIELCDQRLILVTEDFHFIEKKEEGNEQKPACYHHQHQAIVVALTE